MSKRRMPDMKESGVNVTPLIDIIMVLIVFFMLVAKIGVSRGADDDIPLPSTIVGAKLETLSGTLTLNVHWNKSGDEPLLNAMVGDVKKELHISKKYSSGTDQELDRVLKAFADSHVGTANIIIRADKDLPYHQLELVLLSVANAGIGKVSYETKAGADEPSAPTSGSN
jgi:biopolymer transport protein ExbD